MVNAATTAAPATSSRRSNGPLLVLLVGLGVVLITVILGVRSRTEPFDPHSSAPDGYRAISVVLEQDGIATLSVSGDDVSLRDAGPGTVLLMPEPQLASADQLATLAEATRRGATVIHGSAPPSWSEVRSGEDGDDDPDGVDRDSGEYPIVEFGRVDPRTLIDAPPSVFDPKVCDIAALEDLGPIDLALGEWVHLPLAEGPAMPTDAHVVGTCYGSADAAQFAEFTIGSGRMYVMSSPYLWVNAVLKAADTITGDRLDNALTAWRLIVGSDPGVSTTELLVIDTTIPDAVGAADGDDLLGLLPMPFKAYGSVLLLALGLFIWTHAMRLGEPVRESTPVTVESSEFTAAVGCLFMDDVAFLDRGAEAIREQARADLAEQIGLGRDVDPGDLCTILGARTNRSAADVSNVLYGGERVVAVSGVLELESRIERLRTEVADG